MSSFFIYRQTDGQVDLESPVAVVGVHGGKVNETEDRLAVHCSLVNKRNADAGVDVRYVYAKATTQVLSVASLEDLFGTAPLK